MTDYTKDKEVQMDMAFHKALTGVMELEKWIPGSDTHLEISKMCKVIQLLEDKAREKHFPMKSSIHPVFDKILKTTINPGGINNGK